MWEPPSEGLDKYGHYIDRNSRQPGPPPRPQYEGNRGLNFVKEVR